jgi:hypothetical protein
MTVEDRVKMLVGDLMVSIQMLNATIEEQRKKIAELEAQLGSNVESLHRKVP